MKPEPTRPTDAVGIAILLTELGYPTTADQARERLARVARQTDYATWSVRDDAGDVVGFAGGRLVWPFGKDERDAQLVVLVVRHDQRGAGIGRMLVAEFDSWATSHKAARAVVTSAIRRSSAHSFYEQIGFTYTGKRFGKTYPA